MHEIAENTRQAATEQLIDMKDNDTVATKKETNTRQNTLKQTHGPKA
jgi:hypothetical protein